MAGRSAFAPLLSLFSSVRFGIGLLVVLFLYMSVGSAGIIYPEGGRFWEGSAWVHAQFRQWPAFDMTEFEWFHWWPFDVLLGLIAANITVTTLRRIPLKPVNYGVWMIHSGILVLIAGSIIYFSQKVEGDAPVAMRRLAVSVADEAGTVLAREELVVSPGQKAALNHDGQSWQLTVAAIDPDDDYTVTVLVDHDGERFARQLVAGKPEATEDLILTGDPSQPLRRAREVRGTALVEPHLSMELDYASQEWFYLRNDLEKSWALYVREPGKPWHQRSVHGVPLYSDAVADPESVFAFTAGATVLAGLDVRVPPQGEGDPFPDVTLGIDSYLRYAQDRSRYAEGGAATALDPMLWISMVNASGGAHAPPQSTRLAAFKHDERVSEGGFIRFAWLRDESELASFQRPSSLEITLPGASAPIVVPARPSAATDAAGTTVAPDAEGFRAVGGPSTGIAYKVVASQTDLTFDGVSASVAIVEFRTPSGTIRRWVFDDPALCRDVAKDGVTLDSPQPVSDVLLARFTPGVGDALITFIGGPADDQLRVVLGTGAPSVVKVGESVKLPSGIQVAVDRFLPRAVRETRPAIVPPEQRQRDARELFAQVRFGVAEADGAIARPTWAKYSPYPFESQQDALRRHPYDPVRYTLPDGRVMEVIFSRQRLPLNAAVALDEFVLTSHIGGFTGETSSIRDYTSQLRFRDDDGSWTPAQSVSMNAPVEHKGLWFFQAQWDPPEQSRFEGDIMSLGRNYTVLGVGNREGVWIQLAGCVIAVIGMCYAFYVKPIIRRRQTERAKAEAEAIRASRGEHGGATAAAVAVLLVAALSFGTSAAHAEDSSLTEADAPVTFAAQVDLTPLAGVAVHTGGRLKSFGSFSQEVMGWVSGPRRIAGQSPEFTYLDLLFRPDAYADADIIYVKGKPNRALIAEALAAEDPSVAERMEAFMKSGLISPALLERPAAVAVMQQLSGDLIRTAKVVDQVEQALAVREPRFLLNKLRVVPPGGTDPAAAWHGISDVMMLAIDPAAALAAGGGAPTPLPDLSESSQKQIALAWRSLVEAWTAADAPAVNAAAATLASALQQANPSVYPDASKLAWEAWYFRSGNLSWVWLIYLASISLLLLGVIYKWPTARRLGLGVFLIAFALQTAAVMLRWWVGGRWPNANMFEAVTTAAWMGGVLALFIEWGIRRRAGAGLVALGSAVASMVALMAAHFLPMELNAGLGNMMPVLHDVWLYIHTNVVIFSYALIFMAAVTAAMYLGYRLLGGAPTYARAGGSAAILQRGGIPAAEGQGRFGEVLDGVTMMLMELSFVMLWAGIVMGAIWADHSWGRPWGWDPKEVFALNTFVVFALLVHVRLKVSDKGLWTAILAVIGAAVMLFNWVVINFVITGLHSYA